MFEDIHWADDALLDFIDLLADRAGAVPLLIVCTARPELLERRAAWAGGKTNATTISLLPLSGTDTARLVAELLDQALLPANVQHALMERAGGNPLYAQEYVRMLKDRGVLVQTAAGWALEGDAEGLPESIHGIIAARLDTLTPDERSLIQDAAVIGKTAWIGAVNALSERSPWEAEELLHGLERKQLVQRVRRSSIHDGTEFTFSHAITRDVAYNQIRRAERAQKHEAAATWIAELATERDDRAELLAHHYATALDLRRQAGADVTELAVKARDAHAEAGRRALAVNAFAAAAQHLRCALDLTAEDDPPLPALLRDHARASELAGSADEPLVQRALAVQVGAGEWKGAATLAYLLGIHLHDVGDGASADAALDHAAGYAARIPYTPVASDIAGAQAYRLLISGRAGQALAITGAAKRRASDAGDRGGEAVLLTWHGDARLTTGDVAGGIDEIRAGAAARADHGHRFASTAQGNLAESLAGLGDLAGATRSAETASRLVRRYGSYYSIGWFAAETAAVAYLTGDWEAALVAAAESIPTVPSVEAFGRWTRGRITLARGRVDEADADAQQMIDYGVSASGGEALLHGVALATNVADARGDGDAMRVACGRFLDRWHAIGGMLNLAPALADLVPVSGGQHRLASAAELLPEASRWRAAIIHIAAGEYEQAAKRFAAIGCSPLEAFAWMLAAEHAAAAGQASQATIAAQRALTFFRRVNAELYIRRAERALTQPA